VKEESGSSRESAWPARGSAPSRTKEEAIDQAWQAIEAKALATNDEDPSIEIGIDEAREKEQAASMEGPPSSRAVGASSAAFTL
jgi:hypothetical protein